MKEWQPTRKRKRVQKSSFRKRSRRTFIGRRSGPGELKFVDISVTDAVVATGGTIAESNLVLIPQGADESERVGRKCTATAIYMKAELILPDTTIVVNTQDVVRYILYVDHQTNGSAATVTDILHTAAWDSFRNLQNAKRFTFLVDKTLAIQSPSGCGTGQVGFQFGRAVRYLQLYKKLNLPLEYSGTAGTIDELTSNNIGLLTISSKGRCSLELQFRVRYYD